jgi:hypothetical protein
MESFSDFVSRSFKNGAPLPRSDRARWSLNLAQGGAAENPQGKQWFLRGNIWLVVYIGWALPLWKMMESVGMMTFPKYMESHSKFHGSKPPTRYGCVMGIPWKFYIPISIMEIPSQEFARFPVIRFSSPVNSGNHSPTPCKKKLLVSSDTLSLEGDNSCFWNEMAKPPPKKNNDKSRAIQNSCFQISGIVSAVPPMLDAPGCPWVPLACKGREEQGQNQTTWQRQPRPKNHRKMEV